MNWLSRLLASSALAFPAGAVLLDTARAAEADLYCMTGTSSTGAPIFVQAGNAGPAVPCPVSASVTASAVFTGFTPTPSYTTLTATGSSSASTALPTGATVIFSNTGTVAVSCTIANSATATANEDIIQPGGALVYTPGTITHAACIDQTGTASSVVVLSGGAGTPTLMGGLGSGSGGVSSTVTLAAGSAIAAKVGIDQTTPGTTNKVSISNDGTVTITGTTAISAAALPLPTGASTSTNQTSEITQMTSAVAQLVTLNATALTPAVLDLHFGFVNGTSNALRNTATINGTTAATIVPATASLHDYVTDLTCTRTDTGTLMAVLTLNDAAATPIPLAPTGGVQINMSVPIISNGTNAAITATATAGVTGFCRAAGYSGT